MAYVDFSFASPGPQALGRAGLATVGLSSVERQAVLLARTDGLRSLRTPGIVRRLSNRAFKLQSSTRLADPRLEALRSFGVMTVNFRSTEADERQLANLGFSLTQIEDARQTALRLRKPISAPARYIEIVLGWVMAAATYISLRPDMSSSLITAIVSTCLSLPVFSLAARPRPRRTVRP